MKKAIRARLTFSNVISLVALFVALGGTAVATLDRNSVGTRQLRNHAVTTGKIRNGAVTTAKLKAKAVTTGKVQSQAITGSKIKLSSLGTVPTATTAAPFAYARVAFTGTVDPAYAKNITQAEVTHPSPGLYCFDLPFRPKTGQATAESDAEPDDIAAIEIVGANGSPTVSDCPPNNEVEVYTFDTETNAGLQDGDFYIELDT